MALGSSRPYLIRALYDWIIDGGEDPYVVVDCSCHGVRVPENYITNDQIILNLAPHAVINFDMDESGLSFQARFGGIATDIVLPYSSITSVYGEDSGLGMAFGQEPGGIPSNPGDAEEGMGRDSSGSLGSQGMSKLRSNKRVKPNLRIVKSDD